MEHNNTHEDEISEATSSVFGSKAKNRKFRRALSRQQLNDLQVIEAWIKDIKKMQVAVPEGMESHASWFAQQQVYQRAAQFMWSWNNRFGHGSRTFEIPPQFPTNICQKLGLIGPNGELPPEPKDDEAPDNKTFEEKNKRYLSILVATITSITLIITFIFLFSK